MARLPDPVVSEIKVSWDEEYRERNKTLYDMTATAIKKADKPRKTETKGREEAKDE